VREGNHNEQPPPGFPVREKLTSPGWSIALIYVAKKEKGGTDRSCLNRPIFAQKGGRTTGLKTNEYEGAHRFHQKREGGGKSQTGTGRERRRTSYGSDGSKGGKSPISHPTSRGNKTKMKTHRLRHNPILKNRVHHTQRVRSEEGGKTIDQELIKKTRRVVFPETWRKKKETGLKRRRYYL